MYKYFKNIAEKNSCRLSGVCSIHPSVNALYQLLLNEIREISFYVVKLKEFGISNKDFMAQCIEGLSIFLINTSFNEAKYLKLIYELQNIKLEAKEKYSIYCEKNNLPLEIINSKFEIKKGMNVSQLIELSQKHILNEQKRDKSKQNLFELINLISRIASINVVKIKKFEKTKDEFDFEIIRFFALTNSYSIRNQKLIRRIKEFSKTLYKIRSCLLNIYQNNFGKPESIKVNTSLKKGYSILVSGDDLYELQKLLKTIEEGNYADSINVYTNGPLLKAHSYPYFKNNKFLKGHWGSNNAQYDFSSFDGAILITKNFIQKIDSLYRGEIFSNKIISFEKVTDIKDDDFTPVIETALKSKEILKDDEEKFIEIKNNSSELLNYLENLKDEELLVVLGGKKALTAQFDCFENKKILYLSQTEQLNDLFQNLDKLKEENVKITIFFSQCDLFILEILVSLLDKELELGLANCPYSLINPHVLDSLREDFRVIIV